MFEYLLIIILIFYLLYIFLNESYEHMTSESNIACQNVASVYNTGDMTVNNLTASAGQITARGSNAGLSFTDRSNANNGYQWYSTNGNAYLYNGSNIITIDKGGNFNPSGGIYSNNSLNLMGGKTDSSANLRNVNFADYDDTTGLTPAYTMLSYGGNFALRGPNNGGKDLISINKNGVSTIGGQSVPIVQFKSGKEGESVNLTCPVGTSNIGGSFLYGGCDISKAACGGGGMNWQNGVQTVLIPAGVTSIDKVDTRWGDPHNGVPKIWNATYYCQ